MLRLLAGRATLLGLCVSLCACLPSDLVQADGLASAAGYAPHIAAASGEAERAVKAMRVPEGVRVGVFAAEPMLANPVAFGFDERGRVFVVETFRLHHGVTDNRGHMNWLDDDLACKTVEDRVAMYRKFLGKELDDFSKEHDRIRLIEDRDGDGKADHATVFADGFRGEEEGLAAGVLARRGDVWFTCIPKLWKLRDNDHDGKAEVRSALHHGYGVHVAFLGHDLHGLRFGPDGKLYFSVGDRGMNVETEGRTVSCLDSGAVLRCNPDGSELEILATGLRNPQELAFDEYGNLFTCDNNSDSGDRARWVYVVEGGDSGWRMGYQYLESPASRGPWNAEKLWHPHFEGQAAYLVPPLANLSDGPSGLAYEPGTSLLPERYRHHFFLCDFRGSSGQSGVRSFAVKPKGASFEVRDSTIFLWGLEATDVDFGPDGALYVSDWVDGWGLSGKGRLFRASETSKAHENQARQVKQILAEGMTTRATDEVVKLLGHADMRVRQEAQFALVERGAVDELHAEAARGSATLPRIHALWGLGQIGRKSPNALAGVAGLLGDHDPEVRAQAAKVLGDCRAKEFAARVTPLLTDMSPRVRSFAANALGRMRVKAATAPLLAMMRDNADRDPFLRHAGVMGLSGCADMSALVAAASDPSAAVRMGVLLALRRWESPEVARFLDDPDSKLVLEAARAIYDTPIAPALPRLAALASRIGLSEPLLRRVANALARGGRAEDADTLATFAARDDIPAAIRVESVELLADWGKSMGRDRVTGLWRPAPARSASVATSAIGSRVTGLLAQSSNPLRLAVLRAIGPLRVADAGAALLSLAIDPKASADVRAEAIQALDRLDDPRLPEAVMAAMRDRAPAMRVQGQRLLAKLDPERAIGVLADVLERGSVPERQGAFATLATLPGSGADALLSRWLDRLKDNRAPAEVELDLIEAARRRSATEVVKRVRDLDANRLKDDPLARFRDTLAGGDAVRGARVFAEKAEVSCVRCHKANGKGGEVGPDLSGVGGRQNRQYLLESIVTPNLQIAKGFETLMLALDDGQVVSGILKEDDGKQLRLINAEGKTLLVPKAKVEEQTRGASAMPDDLTKQLSKAELRDLVEYLATLK